MSKHPIAHVEFSALDRKVSKKFYQDVFSWEFKDYDEMNYSTFNPGDGVGGGLNPVREDNPAGTVTVYIQTDDITATLAKVEAAGGTIVAPETEIPGTGWFGLFRDPASNLVGLLKWAGAPGA